MEVLSIELWVLMAGAVLTAIIGRVAGIPWLVGVFGLGYISYLFPWASAIFVLAGTLTYLLIRKRNIRTSEWLILLFFLAVLFVLNKFLSGRSSIPMVEFVISTIGISYMVPKLIHLSTEVFKGREPELPLPVFFTYLFFPPTLLAGPIHSYDPFLAGYGTKKIVWSEWSEGGERLLTGLFKIVFIGNFLISTKYTEWLNSLTGFHPGFIDYLDCLRYGSNLYFQFSGFTDIVIAIGLFAGYRLPENFNFPFLANNINDFWKRWHISLSDWTKSYVFFPIFAQTRNAYLAVIATMLVIGLWHEISFRYVLWALFHGAGIGLWQWYRSVKKEDSQETTWKKLIGIIITFNFVILSFAITKEESMAETMQIYHRIFSWIFENVFFFI